jgi:hypothetical protein
VELVRALSNRSARGRLSQLGVLRRLLTGALAEAPIRTRPPTRAGELLRTITTVLAQSDHPMQVAEIRESVERALGRSVNRGSLKACLSEGSFGTSPRFVRIERGVYRLRS